MPKSASKKPGKKPNRPYEPGKPGKKARVIEKSMKLLKAKGDVVIKRGTIDKITNEGGAHANIDLTRTDGEVRVGKIEVKKGSMTFTF